jgi:tRNA 2-selenouridine synthase
MSDAPIVELNVDKSVRVSRLVNEYGGADKNQFLSSMERITKKLGGQHFQKAKELLLLGDMASTIDILLTYYDKAYATGLSKKQSRVKEKISWDGKSIEALAESLLSVPFLK